MEKKRFDVRVFKYWHHDRSTIIHYHAFAVMAETVAEAAEKAKEGVSSCPSPCNLTDSYEVDGVWELDEKWQRKGENQWLDRKEIILAPRS